MYYLYIYIYIYIYTELSRLLKYILYIQLLHCIYILKLQLIRNETCYNTLKTNTIINYLPRAFNINNVPCSTRGCMQAPMGCTHSRNLYVYKLLILVFARLIPIACVISLRLTMSGRYQHAISNRLYPIGIIMLVILYNVMYCILYIYI